MSEWFWGRRASRRRLLQHVAAAGLSGTGLVACGRPPRRPAANQPHSGGGGNAGARGQAGKPRYGGKLTTYAQGDLVTGFEPHAASSFASLDQNHLAMVYNTLVTIGVGQQYAFDDRKVLPSLAASWEQPDGSTYLFHLRPGVKFHDKPPVNARELVADDVVFSLQRLLQSPFGYKTQYETIQTVEGLDPHTVRLKTAMPDAPLLLRLALAYAWIVAREAGKSDPKGAAMNLNFTDPSTAIGTGPFILDQWETGQRVIYRRNPGYFEPGLPYLDQVEVRVVPDFSTQISLLQTGQADVGQIPLGSQGQVRATAPKIQILQYDHPMCYGGGWRNDQAPFTDVRVRRAIALTHDQKEIGASWGTPETPFAYGGPWPVASDGYLPAAQLGDAAKWWQPDVAQAKQLLSAAGFPNGIDTSYSVSAAAQDYEAPELYVSQMARSGVRAKLIVLPHPTFLATEAVGKFDGMGIWGINEVQADDFLSVLVPGAAKNVGHVDDPKLTDMIKQQRMTMDAQARQAQLQQIARYLADQVYLASYPQLSLIDGVAPRVKNYRPRPGNQNVFKVVWLEP